MLRTAVKWFACSVHGYGFSTHFTRAGISEYSNSEAEDQVETLSHEEQKIVMGFVENMGELARKMLDGPFNLETTELRVRGLSAQADISESDFLLQGAAESIEKAVECRSQALSLTPDGHAGRPSQLGELGRSLYRKFKHLGNLADINRAIQYSGKAITLTPKGHPNNLVFLSVLGCSYKSRFDHLGELADLAKVIQYQTLGVLRQLVPRAGGNRDASSALCNLGNSYLCRFERLGELADIEKAIRLHAQAVQITPDGHPDKPRQLSLLGSSYRRRFERLGELADVDKAIRYQAQAVQLIPNNHPERSWRLHNLTNSYINRFQRLGELKDIEQAVECQTQAVALTPDGRPEKASLFATLGMTRSLRFRCLGEVADIDKAIEYHAKAVRLTLDAHPDRPMWLNNLGSSHLGRFERLGELADVDKSIECLIEAVRLTPASHPGKLGWLNNLGISYMRRFNRLGGLADLDKGIDCQTQAMQLTPDGHPKRPIWLSNLGCLYLCRFERLGELTVVDKAIKCQTKAVQLIPYDHPERRTLLHNLGTSYMRRFERLQEPADGNKAIDCQTEAVRLAPDGHPEKPGLLNNLGMSYFYRFKRFGEPGDVDQAIQYQIQAMQLTPEDHPTKSTLLNNLGSSYMRRFQLFDQLTDVDNAIEYLAQAVQLTPEGDPPRAGRLSNLGGSHTLRFERLGQLVDVDKAIECQTQAIQLTPDGHPSKPTMLNNLGRSFESRSKCSEDPADRENARLAFQQGAQLELTDPEKQLNCARNWARLCSLLDLSPKQAFERCMELLPHLIWLGTTIDQRYSLLTGVSTLATTAASWAISARSFDLAIEWLEQGRSIVWNQILQLRTPLDDLSAIDPELAQRLKDIASQLERAGSRQTTSGYRSSTEPNIDLEAAAQHHRRLAAEWEEGLEEARNLSGFGSFMRPRKAAELKAAAINGPVVLINTHLTRWDALILFPHCEEVAHIPLISLRPNEAEELNARLYPDSVAEHRGERAGGFGRKRNVSKPEDPFKTRLTTLWAIVVKPILDALACTSKLPVDELPHVTWCATGGLAFAPLHAAGAYDGSSPNAFDLVISSYTPSLSALIASRTSITQPQVGVLAVGQSETKGQCALPYTIHELSAIRTHVKGAPYLQLNDMNATADAVLGAMDQHGWVHLACHAIQNPDNPAHSAFLLNDGKLTLEMITRRQFKNKGLAFLSACQTAKGDGKMPDEAVHLAAGMLMAGYPSVIATMWSIADIDGPEVAERVYAELLKDGKMDHRGAARALHKAIAELRVKIGVESFERWVPFIHFGV